MPNFTRLLRFLPLAAVAGLLGAPLTSQAQPCGPGYYSPTGQEPCSPCPAGYYQPGTGHRECLECIAGSYNPFTGRAACEPCPMGFISDHYGATSCSPCPAGTYNPFTDQIECYGCGAGLYQPSPGSSFCLPCPMGSFNAGFQRSACDPCPVGMFAPTTGSTLCQPCAASFFAPEPGAIACIFCPTGQVNPPIGGTACYPCPIGTFFSIGAGSCQPCPPGADCSLNGALYGTGCPPGFWRDTVNGVPVCNPCNTGVPVIVQQPPASIDAAVGDNVQIAVATFGFPGAGTLNFYWRHNGVTRMADAHIMGETTAVLHLFPAALADAGDYDAVVSNGCGWVTSAPAHLRVFCRGDFNRSGVVSVQDIFDFLAAYFAHAAGADFNGSGVISVQDIFDFLAAFFAPCA